MAFLPMAVYGLEVPAGDVAIPAMPDFPAAFNITMAAIDPSAEPEGEAKRATLKIIRQPLDMDDYSDEDDEDEDFDAAEMDALLAEGSDDDDDESEDDEEANGGPSDPKKTKAARKAAAQAAIKALLEQDEMDVDEAKTNGVNGKKSSKALGKMPASDEEDEDDDEDDDSEDGAEIEEFVICTLDPNNHYQQPLNLTIGEDERVFFKVSGSYSIHLTGNYIEPAHDHGHGEDDDSEGEYDLSPDEDELDDEYDEESDELDDMEDPRITEIEEEDEAPALIEASKKADAKKGKNKRAAEEDSSTLDAMITDSKAEPTADGEQKLSKKQLKKLKKNDGTATAAGAEKVEEPSFTKSDKKVQFAKNLEQGPTPTKAAADGATPKTSLGVKTVQGVTLDDKKLGTGPAAKNGDRVGMRYIGKLASNNKVFDSNKKGKPFTFKLGKGEVIKGWDIGVAGMSVGQERRITIPAHHGYGSRGAPPDIPGNATLVFDVKVVEINKGK